MKRGTASKRFESVTANESSPSVAGRSKPKETLVRMGDTFCPWFIMLG